MMLKTPFGIERKTEKKARETMPSSITIEDSDAYVPRRTQLIQFACRKVYGMRLVFPVVIAFWRVAICPCLSRCWFLP